MCPPCPRTVSPLTPAQTAAVGGGEPSGRASSRERSAKSLSPLINHLRQANRKHVCERIRKLSWLSFPYSIRDNLRGFVWGRRRQQGGRHTTGHGAIR